MNLAVLLLPAYIGLSAFSGTSPHFPCRTYLHELNRSPAPIFPVLPGDFGDSYRCLKRFTQQNKDRPHAIEVHASNGSGRRTNRLFGGAFAPGLSPASFCLARIHRSRLRALEKRLSFANSNTRIFYSFELEHNCSASQAEKIRQQLVQDSPYDLVNAPDYKIGRGRFDYLEVHGDNPPPGRLTIANNDGSPLRGSLLEAYAKKASRCEAAIYWNKPLQGTGPTWTRPKTRTLTLPLSEILLWRRFLALTATR